MSFVLKRYICATARSHVTITLASSPVFQQKRTSKTLKTPVPKTRHPPTTMADAVKTTLDATYTSPSSAKTFTHPISAPLPSSSPPDTAVEDKVTYLSELRASTRQLQEEINVFLTQKMEEDKAAASVAGMEGAPPEEGKKKDEEKSQDESMEDNYGEEEEDDEDDEEEEGSDEEG